MPTNYSAAAAPPRTPFGRPAPAVDDGLDIEPELDVVETPDLDVDEPEPPKPTKIDLPPLARSTPAARPPTLPSAGKTISRSPALPAPALDPVPRVDGWAVRNDYINNLVRQAKAGSGDAFDSIVTTLKPVIDQRVRHYSRMSSVHPSMLEIDAIVNLQKAVDNYDPDKAAAAGATFSTYARPYIDKMLRTGYEYANIGSIPEHRIMKINTFKTAKDNLTRRIKRQPTNLEISDELGWDVKEVDRMTKELRTELLLDETVAPTDTLNSEAEEMAHFIRMELPPDEQLVYERLTGIGNGSPMKPEDVAKELKMDVTKVYNMKAKIAKRIEKILQEHN